MVLQEPLLERGPGSKVIKSIPSKGWAMDGTVSVGKYASGDLGLDAGPDQGIASMGGEESVHGYPWSGVPTASFQSSVDVSLPELPRSDPLRAEYLPVNEGEIGPVVVVAMWVKGVAFSPDSDEGSLVLSLVGEGEGVIIEWGVRESLDCEVGAGIGIGVGVGVGDKDGLVGEVDWETAEEGIDEYGDGTGMFHPGARSVRYHRPLR